MQDWDLKLYDALRIYNATPTIFNYTPLYLALGIEPHHNLNQLHKRFNENLQKNCPQRSNPQKNTKKTQMMNNKKRAENNKFQEEQQDGRDLVHLRIYELEAIKKARKLHTNLKTRRNAVQNMLKRTIWHSSTFYKRTMGIQN